LLEPQPLEADAILKFTDLKELGAITHIRFNMIPDGGVSRVRLFGEPVL
jgi:allantoicase